MHPDRLAQRKHRLLTRALPVLLIALTAFAVGIFLGRSSSEEKSIERFVDAIKSGDYGAMYEQLSADSKSQYSESEFEKIYEKTAKEAGSTSIVAESPLEAGADPSGDAKLYEVKLGYDSDYFGLIGGTVEFPVASDGIRWEAHLVFPTLKPGEKVKRSPAIAPPRGDILASDGTALAKGPARESPLGDATAFVGTIGAAGEDAAKHLEELGLPADTLVGIDGLELAFDEQLLGNPGSTLYAEGGDDPRRVLAEREAETAKPIKTTIDPDLQTAAVTALGDQLGGVAVLDAKTGDIRALAGIAFSAPQPPGSTFKIVTATAGLAERKVALTDEFPVVVSTDAGGRSISNAHDEPCGGSFVESFAHSCNTVFAPLGVEIGGGHLVDYAERFGFNAKPTLYADEFLKRTDPPPSSLPNPINDPVEVGVSAIGQGAVLATPLEMASAAQTIANQGVRAPTNVVKDEALRSDFEPTTVTTPEVAADVGVMMRAVVVEGTGQAAALESVDVAGKTGTAELEQKIDPPEPAPGEPPLDPTENQQEQDAWFAGYAPYREPELAFAVMIVRTTDDGGVIAAPIAHSILASVYGQ